MGKYKDEHGKTRIGNFLKKVAPELLTVVSGLTGIESLKGLASAISGNNQMSTEDKEMALKLLEMDIEEAKEVSKRWSADMVSDSWLSKNIRPMALGFLTLFMSAIVINDSIESFNFDVKQSYIQLLEHLLVVVYIAYFGSRGFEKYRKIKNK